MEPWIRASATVEYSLIQGPGFSLDTSYGDGGKTITAASNAVSDTSARALALYGFGIFMAGYRSNGHDDDFFLMKVENDSASYPDNKPTQNLMFRDGFEN